jgi:hypothetical protein
LSNELPKAKRPEFYRRTLAFSRCTTPEIAFSYSISTLSGVDSPLIIYAFTGSIQSYHRSYQETLVLVHGEVADFDLVAMVLPYESTAVSVMVRVIPNRLLKRCSRGLSGRTALHRGFP